MSNNIVKQSLFLKQLCLIFICVVSHSTLSAQANIDSLRNIWTNVKEVDANRFKALDIYYQQQTFSTPDSSLAWTDYHFKLAYQKGNTKQQIVALNERALALCILGSYDSALVVMNNIIDRVAMNGDSVRLAATYNNIGNVYYYQNKIQDAVRYFTLSLGINETIGEMKPQGDILNNLGLIYHEIKNPDFAMDYFNRAIQVYKSLNTLDKTGNIWLNIGAVHLQQEDYEKAIVNIKKGLLVLEEHNNTFSSADCHFLLAQAYEQIGRLDSALIHIDKSKVLFHTIGNPQKIIGNDILYANIILKDELNQAFAVGQKALTMALKTNSQPLKSKAYQLMYKCYKAKNNPAQALAMYEHYHLYNDSMLISENNTTIVREAIKSEFEIRELSRQLENEQKLAQLRVDQVKRTFTILFICLLSIALIFFFARRRIQSQKQQLNALLLEIDQLKHATAPVTLPASGFQLNREKIESAVQKKMNETDWKVLNVLLEDPVVANKDIAKQVYLSVDGVGSSLRRMYTTFDIKESKYKKISLLMEAIKLSNKAA